MDNTLYIGLSTARPAEADGALLAQTDGITITAVANLSEQGFIDMTHHYSTLYIPGADPCCPDDQQWGNSYVYTPPTPVIKYRNLPFVLHSWGLWVDKASGTLYLAGSRRIGEDRSGVFFRSTNQAQSWQLLADKEAGTGLYRTYDTQGLHGKLYIIWNDVYEKPCGLAVSEDGGTNWTRLAGMATFCRARFAVFDERLLVLRHDRAALYAVDAVGNISTYLFPTFIMKDWSYNNLAVDNMGYLYMVTEDGRIVRTKQSPQLAHTHYN